MPISSSSQKTVHDIKKIIRLRAIEDALTRIEINGIHTDVEDIHLFCVSKSLFDERKIGTIKHIDIPEQSTDSAASSVVDPSAIAQTCPKDEFYRVWFHSHNQTISAHSFDDRFATQNLFFNKLADTMCTVGIDGITCDIAETDPPTIIHTKWGARFWKEFSQSKSIQRIPIGSIDKNIQKQLSEESEASQIFCNVDAKNGYECNGRNLSHGIITFPIGKFNSVYFDGKVDTIHNFIVATPNTDKFSCKGIYTPSSGRKMICRSK